MLLIRPESTNHHIHCVGVDNLYTSSCRYPTTCKECQKMMLCQKWVVLFYGFKGLKGSCTHFENIWWVSECRVFFWCLQDPTCLWKASRMLHLWGADFIDSVLLPRVISVSWSAVISSFERQSLEILFALLHVNGAPWKGLTACSLCVKHCTPLRESRWLASPAPLPLCLCAPWIELLAFV